MALMEGYGDLGGSTTSSIDYGALATGGGLIGGLTSFYQPFISQNWAANASRRDWHRQKWLIVNSPSLQVKGLRKAGLNPILAANSGLGGGVNNPAGGQFASFDADGHAISQGISTALDAMQARENLKILREHAKQEGFRTEQERENVFINQANSAKAAAEAKIAERNRDVLNETKDTEIGMRKADLGKLHQELELQRAKLPNAKAQAEFDSSTAGQTLIYLRRAFDVIRP